MGRKTHTGDIKVEAEQVGMMDSALIEGSLTIARPSD